MKPFSSLESCNLLSASGHATSDSSPSKFGSSIFNIDIEEVLNQCHPHRLRIANIFFTITSSFIFYSHCKIHKFACSFFIN